MSHNKGTVNSFSPPPPTHTHKELNDNMHKNTKSMDSQTNRGYWLFLENVGDMCFIILRR
jgi:hypothetical protein